jgi:uncharacterized damage-inducible protein DinB
MTTHTNPLIAHFHHLLACETWANARVLASLETIPAGNRSGERYQRAIGLLPHCLLARQVWLWRINAVPYDTIKDWFPPMSNQQASTMALDVDAHWSRYLGALTEAEMAREIHYTASDGTAYVSRVGDILTHVFNHSTYHRGQIARLVTELGGQRAQTDSIVFSRSTAGPA